MSVSIWLRIGACDKEATWQKHQVNQERAGFGQELSELIHMELLSEWEFSKGARKLHQEVYTIK